MNLSTKWSLATLMALAPITSFAQQTTKWDVGPSAILAGSGCKRDVDAFMTEAGNDLAVVFTELGVVLPGNASPVLAGRKTCLVRVGATVAPGYYIGNLTQRLTYGVTKTPRTRGSIATQSTFFNYRVDPYTVEVPYNRAINAAILTNSRVDRFLVSTRPDWYQGFCARNRAPKGIYSANIAVSGQKDSAREDLIMSVDGLDVKYEVTAGPVQCQL